MSATPPIRADANINCPLNIWRVLVIQRLSSLLASFFKQPHFILASGSHRLAVAVADRRARGGLESNWAAVAGVCATNQYIVPIGQDNGAVFFRPEWFQATFSSARRHPSASEQEQSIRGSRHLPNAC
jgi:hypothetical protein